MKYKVSEIYPTIQGEGLLAGTPVTLLRLAGCTVGCSWCDTPYAWGGGDELTAHEVVEKWKLARETSDVVLLTGGEPGEQDLTPLVSALTSFGARVILESAGTSPGWLESARLFDHICVSPKLHKPPLVECLRAAHELKFIIGDTSVTQIESFLFEHRVSVRDIPVFVQPQSGMRAHQQAAIAAARKYDWRLSLQTHKLLGIP
jgi:7-carboxy-7-deazaguanine synthase